MSINEAHQQRKERAALASIAVSALMTVAKFVAGLSSGSLAVLSELAIILPMWRRPS